MNRSVSIAVCAAALAGWLLPRADAQPAQFTPLGFLSGNTWSEAYGVSADGGVVVGRALGGTARAFRWTSATGMTSLPNLPGRGSRYAWAVSADGTVIAGESEGAGSVEACRWVGGGGMELLGGLPGSDSSGASGISADGMVIVGGSYRSGNEAVHWTASGAQGIGDIAGGVADSHANAASTDGSVVVGLGHSASGVEAFRWTAGGGCQGLGDLPGGAFYSTAMATNMDGSIVVGWANGPPGPGAQAFRWTASGMLGLGMLPGATSSVARGVSGNGAVVVGASPFFNGNAFIWTAASGMADLKTYLTSAGATGLDNWTLEAANAISINGRCIVGQGRDPNGRTQAWLAILPAAACEPCDLNCDGSVNQFDIQPFINTLVTHNQCSSCAGDTDRNGTSNAFDINGFLGCLVP